VGAYCDHRLHALAEHPTRRPRLRGRPRAEAPGAEAGGGGGAGGFFWDHLVVLGPVAQVSSGPRVPKTRTGPSRPTTRRSPASPGTSMERTDQTGAGHFPAQNRLKCPGGPATRSPAYQLTLGSRATVHVTLMNSRRTCTCYTR